MKGHLRWRTVKGKLWVPDRGIFGERMEPGAGSRIEGWQGVVSGSVLAGSALFSLLPAFGLGKMVTGRVFPFPWSRTSLDSACFLRWGQAVGG